MKENFIDIYYKEDCDYKTGFKANFNSRQTEFLLKHNDDLFECTKQFSISKGDKLRIYFSKKRTSLEQFFSFS